MHQTTFLLIKLKSECIRYASKGCLNSLAQSTKEIFSRHHIWHVNIGGKSGKNLKKRRENAKDLPGEPPSDSSQEGVSAAVPRWADCSWGRREGRRCTAAPCSAPWTRPQSGPCPPAARRPKIQFLDVQFYQCCGSMTFWCGSGSGFCYFRHWPSKCQQKINLKKSFSAYYFLKLHVHYFSKIKSQKDVTKQEESRFF